MRSEPGTSVGHDDRDTVLVCAEEPLRSALAELVRARGYELVVSKTPLDTVGTLLASGDRIGYALISAGHAWGVGLDAYLADEFPAIQRTLLAA